MSFGEKLLLFLSKEPESSDCETVKEEWNAKHALALLNTTFPDFTNNIAGKTIVDFGCGDGWQSLALAKSGAKHVLGLDTNFKNLNEAVRLAKKLGLTGRVEFTDMLEDRFKGKFDMVISQNSMEHFGNPAKVLNEMKSTLKQDGTMLITFGPPWYAPYGSHMHFFTRIPWVNILFSEKSVMNVRAHFRDDGATKYEEVEFGLNKMSVAKFERVISSNKDMKIRYKKYSCVKGMDLLGKIPFLRELFINRISCIVDMRA